MRSRASAGRLDAWASTVLLLAVLVGVPIWAGSVFLDVSRGVRPAPFDLVVVPLLVVWGIAAAATFDSMRRAPLKRARRLSADGIIAQMARFVERSSLGVGSQSDWTSANPDVTLSALVAPGDAPAMTGAPPAAQPAVVGAQPVLTSETETPVVTTEVEVRRGDTWWSLAERHAAAGMTWRELRDLNVGREVAPGVELAPDALLRPGYRIQLPVVTGDE